MHTLDSGLVWRIQSILVKVLIHIVCAISFCLVCLFITEIFRYNKNNPLNLCVCVVNSKRLFCVENRYKILAYKLSGMKIIFKREINNL